MGAYADDPQLANALNRKQIMGGGGAQGNPGVGGGTQMSPPVYSNPVAPVRTPMPPQGGGGTGAGTPWTHPSGPMPSPTPPAPPQGGGGTGGTAFDPGYPVTPLPTPPTPAGGGWGVDKPNPNPNPPQGGGNGGGYASDPVRYPGRDPLGPPAVRKPRYTVPYSGTTKDTGSYVNPRSAGRPRGY